MKSRLLGGVDGERRFAVVLSTDDKIKDCLQSFATSLSTCGNVHGIGAVRRATLGFWNAATRAYEHIEIEEQAEVLSLVGNLAVAHGQFALHAHAVLGLRDGRAVGGHLVEAIVHPTLEVLFIESTPTLRRTKDADTGLDLLDLS